MHDGPGSQLLPRGRPTGRAHPRRGLTSITHAGWATRGRCGKHEQRRSTRSSVPQLRLSSTPPLFTPTGASINLVTAIFSRSALSRAQAQRVDLLEAMLADIGNTNLQFCRAWSVCWSVRDRPVG